MFEAIRKMAEKRIEDCRGVEAQMKDILEAIKILEGYRSDPRDLGKLIDRVDHLGRELENLKTQMIVPPRKKSSKIEGQRLDLLFAIMQNRPGRYTSDDIADRLGVAKSTALRIMRQAEERDPVHVKITQGDYRRIYIHYYPSGIPVERDLVKAEIQNL